MRAFSVTSEKLQNFSALTWVSTDVAIAANYADRCLYEIVLPPSLRGVRASKITQPFESSILSICSLPGGCGAGPSSSATGPTSQANPKSPYQLSRGSGQSGDFGQTVLAVGTSSGLLHFLYVDVVPLGGSGQRLIVRRTKAFNMRECVGGAEEVLPVTSLCMTAPRGAQLLVGTETGHLLLFAMTGGQFAFKQVLRADLGAPVHAVHGISRTHFAFSTGNRLEVAQYQRPGAAEAVIRLPEASFNDITTSGTILAASCEADGVVFYDLSQNLQISHFQSPPGDVVRSVSVSSSNGDILAATAAGGLLVFNKSGIMKDTIWSGEVESQDGTNGIPGGIFSAKFAPFGGAFLGICQAGLIYGCVYFQRLSAGGIVFEPASELKVRITDNNLQINDVYQSPEPIINVSYSENVFVATTATSVIVWRPPTGKELQELKNSGSGRNQWILEPQRTQSFSEASGTAFSTQEEGKTQQNVQMVGGVAFGSFNFQQTEEEAAKAAIQEQSSQITKNALFLRHSILFAKASQRYVLLQDISGEAQLCSLNGLGLVTTLYTGQVRPENLCLTDDVLIICEGNNLKIVETMSGNFICRSLSHQRRIQSVAIGQIKQTNQQNTGQPQIQIGGLFGDLAGAGGQNNQQQISKSDSGAILALLDVSGAVFVGRLQSPAYYQKFTQTTSAGLSQLKLSSKALDVAFPTGSEILTILAQDCASYPNPTSYIGGVETSDYQSRLRVLLFGRPADHVASLPAPLFVCPSSIAVQTLLRAAAGIGFDEVSDNSSRQIQQYKLLQRQSAFTLERVSLGQRGSLGASDVVSCASATVCLLSGICHCIVALPEFPFVLESSIEAPEVGGRICRYVQQPGLWALQCSYCKARRDNEGLKLALAAVGQVPKALCEASDDSIQSLVERGHVGKAVAQCCDLWDFDGARALVARDRRFGPLLVFLRRQRHAELGSIADEKSEPWAALAREFGDKATESCLQLIE